MFVICFFIRLLCVVGFLLVARDDAKGRKCMEEVREGSCHLSFEAVEKITDIRFIVDSGVLQLMKDTGVSHQHLIPSSPRTVTQ